MNNYAPLKWMIWICLSAILNPLRGQSTYTTIAQDTIITRPVFLGNVYLLDGKKLTLEVMEFFMDGHSDAYNQVKVAAVTEQISLAGYSIGGVLLLSGVLIGPDNPAFSRDLILYGAIGFGTGLLFQGISGSHKQNAVRLYNDDIKRYYKEKGIGIHLLPGKDGVGVVVIF